MEGGHVWESLKLHRAGVLETQTLSNGHEQTRMDMSMLQPYSDMSTVIVTHN